MAKEILSARTAAGQSLSFGCDGIRPVTIIMYAASGLTASEYGDIQISHDGGTTWQDMYIEGVQQRLSNVNVATTVYGTGRYRVDKEVTSNAALIAISYDGNT